MKKTFFILLIVVLINSCTTKRIELEERYGYQLVISGDHKLATKTFGEGDVTVIFESGLAGYLKSWENIGIISALTNDVKVVLYNRPGISPSDKSNEPANIENMLKDLDSVVSALAQKDKLILVGHSLGGAIIRAYSIKYPQKVNGLVFIDTSHEVFLEDVKQEEIIEQLSDMGVPETDVYYKELIYLENTLKYLSSIGNLPDIPVVVLTATEGDWPDGARESWIEAHQSLGIGVSDFTHLKLKSGHFIQNSHPEQITSSILEIVNKI